MRAQMSARSPDIADRHIGDDRMPTITSGVHAKRYNCRTELGDSRQAFHFRQAGGRYWHRASGAPSHESAIGLTAIKSLRQSRF
jgi:hypothetical protein